MYKNALGRSDSYHNRISLGIPILTVCIVVLFNLLNTLSERNNMINNFFAASGSDQNRSMFVIGFIFIILLLILGNYNGVNFKKIVTYSERVKNYVNYSDSSFLSTEENKILKYYSDQSKNDTCVQIFSHTSIFPYLLKKPTCTRFFAPLLASPEDLQKKFVAELSRNLPSVILYKSPYDLLMDDIPNQKRLPIVNSFILQNYETDQIFGYWVFLRRKR